MATNGSISVVVTQWDTLKFIWETTSQSVENNTSNVSWKLNLITTGYGRIDSTQAKDYTVTVNGTKYTGQNYIGIGNNATKTIISGSTVITHNADGSKSFSFSFTQEFDIRFSGKKIDTISGSGTGTLEDIPRAATITDAPNFDDEDNPTIKYSNPAGSAVSKLEACISLDGSKDDIAYRDISKTGSSYTFNLTAAERNVLRNAAANDNSITVRFYVATTIGGTIYRKYLSKTLTIINANPSLNPTAVDVGKVSTVLTGDANNKVIKYYNSMDVAANATALKGASIKSYKISCGGKSITTSSGKLNNVESGSFTFTVTDSRGNTTTKTLNKTLINYVKLTCNLSAKAPTTDGEMSITISGNYFNGSFGANSNALIVQYRLKENSGSYGEWITAAATLKSNKYSADVSITGLNYRSTYTIQARALDAIYNADTEPAVESAAKTVKTTPVFDWGANDFAFNVPVSMPNGTPLQGNNAEGDKINLAYITTGTSNLQVGGGAYAPTNIFINTKDNEGAVSINGKAYGVNRVLWTGSYYMTEGQTAKLEEPVSEQTTGIILVFSRYDIANSEALNEHFSYHFVPKQLVALHDGKGSVFNMNTVSYSFSGSKYLYISDTEISGNTNNDAVGTGDNGISYNNNRFVLRYVIGV